MNGGLCNIDDDEKWTDWATCHNLVSIYLLECAQESDEEWGNLGQPPTS